MGTRTVTADRLLRDAVKRSGRRSTVQLPGQFVRKVDPDQTRTPLSEMFEGGEAPMKLYLTLVLLTCAAPHDLHDRAADHYWAEMLGYEEQDHTRLIAGAGTKRIKRAMRRLTGSGPTANTRWVARVREPGKGYKIEVTHLPRGRAPYITVPLEFWSHGWIAVISARALFVYLILRLILAGKDDHAGTHVNGSDRGEYLIKDDTWQRGLKELEELHLVRTEIAKVVPDRWSNERIPRKVVYLNNEYLKTNRAPTQPVDLDNR
ncbi:hypothetical protein ACFQZZ_00630 [Nocardia sp. GCM10030253]|uniref:hypothetical protein n=1 Tax=Nocardia sp. GCM10030253 TaxID=3273404 RepID=UPI00363517AF